MIRTSRKWKNAVRFQAALAAKPEWKVFTAGLDTQGISIEPNATVVNLFSNIAQGSSSSDRIGSRIRVHRIDIWITFYAQGAEGENPVACALVLGTNTTKVPLTQSLNNYFEPVGGPYSGWVHRTVPRLKGGSSTVITEEYARFLVTKRRVLAGVPMISQTSSWVASAPDNFSGGTRQSITNQVNHGGTGGTMPGGAWTQSPYVSEPMVPMLTLRRPLVHHLKLSRSWKRGLPVQFDDSDADGVDHDDLNHCFLFFSQSIEAVSQQSARCNFIYRVWYSDE